MTSAAMQISSKSIRKSSSRLSTKNAWAQYVRNRWPQNTLSAIQIEWNLTEGEARGVLYAQASQTTIDKMLDHGGPIEGFRLSVIIAEIRMQIYLADYITHQAQEARHEKRQREADERQWRQLQADLDACDAGGCGLDGSPDQQTRPHRTEDAPVGRSQDGRPVEAKSYAPRGRRP